MRKFVEFKFCLINASNFLPIYYGRIRQSKICEKTGITLHYITFQTEAGDLQTPIVLFKILY